MSDKILVMKKTLLITALSLIAASAVAVDAPALWDKHCASCHAKDGSGNTRMGKKTGARDYRDAKVQESIKDDAAFKAVKDGLKENGTERMKPYSDKLNDEEIKALIAHMRSFKK